MDSPAPPASTARSLLDRIPSWVFLAFLAGLIGLAFLLGWLAPAVFWNPPTPPVAINEARCHDPAVHEADTGFFYRYYWLPILCDEGYNPVNTASWAILFLVLVLWAYRLTNELGERVDLGLTLAVVPYLVWGSVYRVLEDADLFAPYGNAQPPPPLANGFLDQYLGVFFITPIIYVEVTFIAVLLLLWGHRARRVAASLGPAQGVRYFALTLVLLFALYVALWASKPTFIRFVANPLVALAAALVAFWIVYRSVERSGRLSARVTMGAYGVFFLVIGLYYVFVWMAGGQDIWHPLAADPAATTYPLAAQNAVRNWPVQWWVFAAAIAAPLLIAYSCRKKGFVLGGGGKRPADLRRVRKTHGRVAALLVVLVLVESLLVFLSILGVRDLAQRQLADAWTVNPAGYVTTFALVAAGPVGIALGTRVASALAQGPVGVHPVLFQYAAPVNLLMVLGQMTDALMTSLGIDLYNYSEKHVLPRFLIDQASKAGLPAPLGDFPTAVVMIPLKLLIVLFVIVAIDAASESEARGRENLVGLVKLGIIMVGLSPGVRDAVRLAMAT